MTQALVEMRRPVHLTAAVQVLETFWEKKPCLWLRRNCKCDAVMEVDVEGGELGASTEGNQEGTHYGFLNAYMACTRLAGTHEQG